MKKVLVSTVVALLLVALLAAVGLLAGCGGSSSSGNLTPEQVLEQSNKKMESVKSFKANGSYSMKTGSATGTAPDAGADAFTYEMLVKLTGDKGFDGRMAIKGGGQDTDIYISDGWAYFEVEGTGWVKQKMDESGSISAPTPADMAEFSKGAENLKLLPSDGEYYKISFNVSPAYFEKAMSQQGATEGVPAEYSSMMKELAKQMKMSAEFTINKNTMYLEDVNMKISMGEIPQVGKMDVSMDMVFSDYNKPVAVSLPPEAKGAKEMPATTEGGVPGIPGLGL